jgi:DNA-binding XRE family transcriptional regulator
MNNQNGADPRSLRCSLEASQTELAHELQVSKASISSDLVYR